MAARGRHHHARRGRGSGQSNPARAESAPNPAEQHQGQGTDLYSAVVLLQLFFGGAFVGLSLLVAADYFSGLPVALLYFVGTTMLSVQFESRWAFLRASIFTVVLLLVFQAMSFFVGYLAASGAYGQDASGRTLLSTEKAITAAAIWFALGVPNRGFVFGLGAGGREHARRLVIGTCTFAASVLTGAYVVVLHFGGGPFSKVDMKALVVGTVFTVFLIAPGYRALAMRCWERGLRRLLSLSGVTSLWRQAAAEVDAAYVAHAEAWLESREAGARSKPGDD